jgi:hypothetical protein
VLRKVSWMFCAGFDSMVPISFSLWLKIINFSKKSAILRKLQQ